jgi:protein CpxP
MDYIKKDRYLIYAVIVLLVLNIVSISYILFAPRPPAPDSEEEMRDPIAHFLVGELNFSDEQMKQFAELRKNHFEQGDTLIKKHSEAMKNLFDLLKKDTVSTIEIQQKASALGEIETERSLSLYQHFHAVRSLCSPEQQRKFDEFIVEVLNRVHEPPKRPGPEK